MEKGKFGKIRQALVEQAKQNYISQEGARSISGIYTSEDLLSAKEHFKELHREDPEIAGIDVKLKVAESAAREKLGDPLWTLYKHHWGEEWDKQIETLQSREKEIAESSEFVGEYSQRLKEMFRNAVDEITESTLLKIPPKYTDQVRDAVKIVNSETLELLVHASSSSEED